MKISDAGIELLKLVEGLELVAYADEEAGGTLWTIGYGHTGSDVYEGLHITEERAVELLRRDIATAEKCVNNSVKVPMTQGQFDALCSFVYNIGCKVFGRSTLLAKLNAGDDGGAADEFGKWVYDDGKKLNGLVLRRKAEADLFRSA